tara:strand:- start:6491 stop:6931 length:441 start_codon:yes stop_codon:yes gene_type:complete
MRLDSLNPAKGSVKKKKRKGRGHGTGLGKTSGRGHKGSGQRSGNKKRPWFEGGQMPLSRRLPRKGFNNIFREKFQIVNICDIVKIKKISDFDAVILNKNGLVRSALKPIKILGDGDIDRKINIKATSFSEAAKNKIEKAGGIAIVE